MSRPGLAALKAAAAQRLAAGQAQLDLGLAERSAAEPLSITSSKSALLWEASCAAYDRVGFGESPILSPPGFRVGFVCFGFS
jgi:hypothetical protein